MSQSANDDCIDLTEEVATDAAADGGGGGSLASASSGASLSLTPKQMMQSKLMQGPWNRTKPAAAAAGSGATLASPSRLQLTPSGRAQPRLQLSSIPHTTSPGLLPFGAAGAAAASSQSTAASSSAATAAPRSAGSARLAASNRLFGGGDSSAERNGEAADVKPPVRLSQLLSQASQASSASASSITSYLLPQPFNRATAATQSSQSAAAKYKREPGTAPPAAAAATAAGSATAPFSFTPPASSSSLSNGHAHSSLRAPQSAPQLRNASGATLAENEDERLVRRRNEIDAEISELDEQILAIQARQRTLKSERRDVQARLDRPVQIVAPPSLSSNSRSLAPAVGGASSLLSGSDFWKGQFDWDAAARHTMQSVFGLSSYRVSQREVVNATMSGKDCFVIMPTGAGKCWGRDTKLLLFTGQTITARQVVRAMDRGETVTLMGDDNTPRHTILGTQTRGNTRDDDPRPAKMMDIKMGHEKRGAGRSRQPDGKYECKYDRCDYRGNNAGNRHTHENNAKLHTLEPATEPFTYRITSTNGGRPSWTCNGDHILVVKFNVTPTAVKQWPKQAEEQAEEDGTQPWYFGVYSCVNGVQHADGTWSGGKIQQKTFSFESEEAAHEEHVEACIRWRPLVWQCTVHEFLRCAASIRAKAQMFQPAAVQFQQAAGQSLRHRLKSALTQVHKDGDAAARLADGGLARLITPHMVAETAWVLGMWLTDGLASHATISQIQHDQYQHEHSHTLVVKRLVQWYNAVMLIDAEVEGQYVDEVVFEKKVARKDGREGNTAYRVKMGPVLRHLLEAYQLLDNKHFPHHLLSETKEARMALLAGVLDGDGWASPKRCYQVAAKERVFIDGLIHLARGLGFSTGKVGKKSCTNEKGDVFEGWRVIISGVDLPKIKTVLPYKRFAASDSANKDQRCDGFSVKKNKHKKKYKDLDYFGFQLDGNGRCLMGDFVVTHNLPALLNEGVTLVISPLLSLMEDQLIYLRSVGIESFMLCGTTSREDAKHVHEQMTDPRSPMRLLYVTPEKIAKSKQFLSKLERMAEIGKLSRIVIDEVHCCSQWGHDFRPDYRKLSVLKTQFPTVPILAVTATATDKVARDCISILKIQGCQQFKCSFNRPNLHYSVRDKSSTNAAVAKDMYRFIESIGHLDSSGIVYCYSKKETMEVCSQLSALGISCDFYNSDVSPENRQRVHHRWVRGQIKVVVATNAFGLGINKPDVRFVLHHTIPQSIETYAQESGRAGRDGLKSYCGLWYSPRDLPRQSIRVYANQEMTSHLYPMVLYCHQLDQCRRVGMSRHFGEAFHPSQCNRMCDVCELMSAAESGAATAAAAGTAATPTFIIRDLSEAAIQLCDFVDSNSGGGGSGGSGGKAKGKRKRASAAAANITQKQLVDELRSRTSSVTLPKGMSRDDCERLIIELMLQGVLKETFKNTAYSTISYLKTDPHLSQQLRNGDLLIQLRFVDPAFAKQHAAEGAGTSATPKRRAKANKSGTVKGERVVKGEASSSAAAAAGAATADDDGFDLDDDRDHEPHGDDDYEQQHDDAEVYADAYGDPDEGEQEAYASAGPAAPAAAAAAAAAGVRRGRLRRWSAVSDDDDDDFDLDDGASSEDVPIKKTRRDPASARLQQQQSQSSRAPRRTASSAPKQSYQEEHGFELPDSDEEDALRQTLEQSMHDF